MREGVVISTVLTVATSYALIDIGTLKALLGVTTTDHDAAFAIWVTQASDVVHRYCNRVFAVETVQDQIWPLKDGIPWTVRPNDETVQLSRWPLVSVASVVETIAGVATTLAAGTDYLVDQKLGHLYRLDQYGNPRRWSAAPLAVQFTSGYTLPTTGATAGYEPLPSDLIAAVADLVKGMWYAQTRDPMIRSQNIPGVYESAYFFATGPGGQGDLPVNVQAKLDRYRVPVIR